MPAVSLVEALYTQLDAATASPVSPELRRQGDPTPAVVYEITSCEFSVDMEGTLVQHGKMTLRLDCVADSVVSAWNLAEAMISGIDGKWTRNTYDFVLVGVEIAQTRANPDDGQSDAERVATVTAQLQFKENS